MGAKRVFWRKAVHELMYRENYLSYHNSKMFIDWLEATRSNALLVLSFFPPCLASSSRVQERVKGRRKEEHRGVGNVARNTQKGDDGFVR